MTEQKTTEEKANEVTIPDHFKSEGKKLLRIKAEEKDLAAARKAITDQEYFKIEAEEKVKSAEREIKINEEKIKYHEALIKRLKEIPVNASIESDNKWGR